MSAYFREILRIALSTTARHTAIVLGGNLVSGMLRFVVAAMLAKFLSVPEWGTFVLFVTLMDMVSIFTDAALNSTFVRFVSNRGACDPRPLLRRCLGIKIGLSVLVASLALAAYPVIGPAFDLPPDTFTWYALALCAGLLLSFNTFSLAILQVHQRFALFALQTASINIVRIVLIGGLVYAGWHQVEIYYNAFFGATLVALLFGGLVCAAALLRKDSGEPLNVSYAQLWRFMWPLTAMNLLTVLFQRVDILLLNRLTTPEVVGQYGLAFQVAFVFPLFTSALFTALLPRVSAMKSNAELRQFRAKSFQVYPIVLVAAVAGAVVLPVAVQFIFGDKYNAALPILRLLILSYGINLLFNPLGLILYALERPHALTWIQAIKLPLLIGLDLLLVPALGGLGAALGITVIRAAGVVAIVWWTGRLLRETGTRIS